MAAELLAEQDGTVFVPAALDGVTWETHRSGAPGTLTFTALEEDGAPSLREGARVSLRLDGEGLFCGYVFTRARSAGGRVEVTAYDQLRYLRSRDTLLYEGKTASALLRMLAADFRLTLGDVEETGYAIPIGAEENVPVWDMVENALDETYRATGRRYVLYDDFGKLCLKSAGSLALPLLLDENTVSAYRCEETIDEGAYSRVRLLYEDGRRGVRQLFSGGDESLQERWGVLQYFEKLQDPTGGQSLVESILRAQRSRDVHHGDGGDRQPAGTGGRVAARRAAPGFRRVHGGECPPHFFRRGAHDESGTEKRRVRKMAQTAVGLVKQAAVEAVQAEKPLELRFGSVVSSSPLTVRVEEKLLLTSAFLLIPERLTDLLPGDRVALLRVQGGGRYLLLDRLGGAV